MEECVDGLHAGSDGVFCREDGVAICLRELTEECEVHGTLGHDVRAVALRAGHGGDVEGIMQGMVLALFSASSGIRDSGTPM